MRNAHVYLRREPAIENQQFMETKILMFNIHTLSDKAFQGTFVNLRLLSLPWGSLKITLTVPLWVHHLLGIFKIVCINH